MRLGLDRIEALLAALGRPEAGLRIVHIGGTNGKGSVAALTAAILQAAGLRTGLYTSPHLLDVTERVRIDGRAVPRGGPRPPRRANRARARGRRGHVLRGA